MRPAGRPLSLSLSLSVGLPLSLTLLPALPANAAPLTPTLPEAEVEPAPTETPPPSPIPRARPAKRRGPAYKLDLAVDLPVLAIAGVVSSGWLLKGSLAGPHCAPLCDRGDVPVFDRWAAGTYDAGWRTASDIGVAAVVAGSALTLLAAEGPSHALNDAVVVGQSILLANTLAIVSMMSVRRPRPFAHGTEAPLEARTSGDASLSFFSGHAAGSVAAAVSMYITFRRLNRPALAYASLGLGLATATFIGVTRVASGDHFPSDVLAGAAVGASTGVLFPALHESPRRLAAIFPSSVGAGHGLSIAGVF